MFQAKQYRPFIVWQVSCQPEERPDPPNQRLRFVDLSCPLENNPTDTGQKALMASKSGICRFGNISTQAGRATEVALPALLMATPGLNP
jgi:hypothetical protein